MVKCDHCGVHTVALGPAPHEGSIGQCPGCNRVLTYWVKWNRYPEVIDAQYGESIQDILDQEDNEFLRMLRIPA